MAEAQDQPANFHDNPDSEDIPVYRQSRHPVPYLNPSDIHRQTQTENEKKSFPS